MSYDEHLISMAGGDGDTVDQLAAIEARAQAATEGPWKASDFGHPGRDEPSSIIIHKGAFNWRAIHDGEYVAAMTAWDSQEDADADFIAHARTDVPALLALVREQQATIDRVEAQAARWATLSDGHAYYAKRIRHAIKGPPRTRAVTVRGGE